MVALGPLYPAQMEVPLGGVARVNEGFTVAVDRGQVTIVVGPVALQP